MFRSVEAGAFDVEADAFQPLDQGLDRLCVAGFAFDLDHRVLGRQSGEVAVMVGLDDIDPTFVETSGNRGERAGAVLGVDLEARDAQAIETLVERLEAVGFHVERASLD